MTTEFHDDASNTSDTKAFWTTDLSTRRLEWGLKVLAAVTGAVVLILILTLGIVTTKASNRLWSIEEKMTNLTDIQALAASLKNTKDAAKEVNRLQFAVESNKDQLISVSEALKELSTLEILRRTVAGLSCSVSRLINNSTAESPCCDLHWDLFRRTCYYFSSEIKNWNDARDWCSASGGHLVILTSSEEWTYVRSKARHLFFWIGLTDERTGKWEWVNQSPYVMDRRQWKPNQPDNWAGDSGIGVTEDCAHLHANGQLNDLHCTEALRFICQKHTLRS